MASPIPNPPSSHTRPWLPWLLAPALSLLTVLAYAALRHHDFVYFDDPDYITNNPHIKQGVGAETIRWAFTTFEVSNWHPLTWLSHALDYSWFGDWAGGHHLTSLGLHVLNTLLLFLLLRRFTGALWRSAVVAALFALHPLHVESVAWIAERKDLLSGLFFFLCLLAYAGYARRKTAGQPASLFYLLALLAFAAGLMSKPMLVTLPCVLLLVDFWPLQRFSLWPRTDWRTRLLPCVWEKIPFFALTLASSILTFVAQKQGSAVVGLQSLPITTRALNAALGYAGYLAKSLWPTQLSVFYPFPAELPYGKAFLALAVLAGISAAVTLLARRAPWWTTGWFWFLGMMVPVVGLVQVGSQAMADRYTYLPLIGLFIAVTWAAAAWAGQTVGRQRALAGATVLLLGAYAWGTRDRVADWRNTETLFTQALQVTERNFPAHANLGVFYWDRGDFARAESHFQSSIAIQPDYAPSWRGLSQVYMSLQRYREAIAALERDAVLCPRDPIPPANAGLAWLQEKNATAAEHAMRESLRRDTNYLNARLGLALALLAQGRTNDARALVDEAARQPSQPASALDLLAMIHEQLGDPARALEFRQRAVQAAPRDATLRQRLGQQLASTGRTEEARREFLAAVEIAPANALARSQLATVLLERGETRAAVTEYRAALSLQTNLVAALNNLAWILATHPDDSLRNGADAVVFGRRACELAHWEEAYLIGTLAAAYAENGQWQEALDTALKAQATAKAAGNADLAARNGELAEWYRARKPYRDPPARQ